ncbi:MAG: hypothetical protein COB67_01060 [SAR324 cluster bacterium]|uniref:NADPH-dependent FMN reductase-like domain-containing protein n=1 Tax=SAR324 cluster bacterium TaxID=2024889 RepID=A0A2A4TBN2_9DELT|nr:MAG: hypothetical protein COB67_01060 [SAR324 cluster bacterium]
MTKVIVINSSPKMKHGTGALLLAPFIEGMEEEKAEVELVHLQKLDLKTCIGCMNCWFRTPGICSSLKDEMSELLDKMIQADYWILSTPIYAGGVSTNLKILMERTLPIVEPMLDDDIEHCVHLQRTGYGKSKVVLFATAGLLMEEFHPAVCHLESYCRLSGKEFVNAVLRPQAGMFKRQVLNDPVKVEDILSASKQAGRQLIKEGKISEETLATISREFMSLEEFRKIYNRNTRNMIERGSIRNVR